MSQGRHARRAYVLGLIGLLSTGAMALAQPRTVWNARYNGPDNGEDLPFNGVVDGTSNTIIVGESTGATTGLDFVTIKYNPAGIKLWERRYDGPAHGDDEPFCVAVDKANNIYVHGHSWGGPSAATDLLTLKYDPNGTLLWERRYNGTGSGRDETFGAQDLALDDNANVYVTGYSWAAGQYWEAVLLKYDTNGTPLWDAHYAGPQGAQPDSAGYGVGVAPDGSVRLVGSTVNAAGDEDYLILSYAPGNGQLLWERAYDSPFHAGDTFYAMKIDGASNTILTGVSEREFGGGFEYATVKYAPNGDFLWASRYGGPGYHYALAVATDAALNAYVTGASTNTGGDYNIVTIKYSPTGTELWTREYSDPYYFGDDWGEAITVDAESSVYVTGYTWRGFSHGNDRITLKYDDLGHPVWKDIFNGPASGDDAGFGVIVDGTSNTIVFGPSLGAGTQADFLVTKYSQYPLGDANCDTYFDGGDIDPFFLALGNPAGYQAAYPYCDVLNCDINGDGSVDGADIDAFFALLGG
jgi:hypothetical protein